MLRDIHKWNNVSTICFEYEFYGEMQRQKVLPCKNNEGWITQKGARLEPLVAAYQ